jgi:hypothetical protein
MIQWILNKIYEHPDYNPWRGCIFPYLFVLFIVFCSMGLIVVINLIKGG